MFEFKFATRAAMNTISARLWKLPGEPVLANLANLAKEARALGNDLRELQIRENPALQSEIAKLKEAGST
jgi:hypothetical protein